MAGGRAGRRWGGGTVPTPELPDCKFRFFPRWSLWSGERWRGFWGRGPPPLWFLIILKTCWGQPSTCIRREEGGGGKGLEHSNICGPKMGQIKFSLREFHVFRRMKSGSKGWGLPPLLLRLSAVLIHPCPRASDNSVLLLFPLRDSNSVTHGLGSRVCRHGTDTCTSPGRGPAAAPRPPAPSPGRHAPRALKSARRRRGMAEGAG